MKLLLTILLFPFYLFSQQATGIVIRIGSGKITVAPGNKPIAVVPSIPSNIYVADVKADLERLTNITIAPNGKITANRAFIQADIGKCLIVMQGRNYAAYQAQPMTLNAVVTSVSLGQATVVSYDTTKTGVALGTYAPGSGLTGFVATDNYDAMNTALTMSVETGKNILLNYIGTAYICPQRHPSAEYYVRSYGLTVNSSTTISGLGAGTILKFGKEDIMDVDATRLISYAGFSLGNCTLRLNNLTFESADRTGTQVDYQNVKVVDAKPVSTNETGNQNIISTNVSITSPQPEKAQGWGGAYYMNNSSYVNGTALMEHTGGVIQAQAGPAFFNANTGIQGKDTAHRVLRIINSDIIAGAIYAREVLGSVKVTAGSDTIEVLGNDDWSFYNLRNYINIGSNNPDFVFTLVNVAIPNDNPYTGYMLQANSTGNPVLTTANALYCRIIEVISPTKCRIQTSGTSNGFPNTTYQAPSFTSTTCNLYTSEGSQWRWAAFHAAYRSGNVGIDMQNVKASPLRYILNTQNAYGPQYIGIIYNVNCVHDRDVPAAEKLRKMLQGPGFQTNSQECGIMP